MVHLIGPIFFIYAAAVVAAFVVFTILGQAPYPAIRQALFVAALVQAGGFAFIYGLWRFIPGFTSLIFPYVGGDWNGSLTSRRDGTERSIEATIHIEQSIASMSLLLGTENAESETIVVYPRKLSNGRFDVHYIYETRSRIGRPPPSYRYRGTAEIRIKNNAKTLEGSYYTEQGGCGTFLMTRVERTWFRDWLRRSKT